MTWQCALAGWLLGPTGPFLWVESVPFSRGDQGSSILGLETSSQSLTSGRTAETLSSGAREEAPTMFQEDGEHSSLHVRAPACRC